MSCVMVYNALKRNNTNRMVSATEHIRVKTRNIFQNSAGVTVAPVVCFDSRRHEQVLHPSAMAPCIEGGIEVHVRNIFNPEHRYTTGFLANHSFFVAYVCTLQFISHIFWIICRLCSLPTQCLKLQLCISTACRQKQFFSN